MYVKPLNQHSAFKDEENDLFLGKSDEEIMFLLSTHEP